MTRWKLESSTSVTWTAKCKMCGRIAISKGDMSACPKGCHIKESAEVVKARAVKKSHSKPQPSLLVVLEKVWERQD